MKLRVVITFLNHKMYYGNWRDANTISLMMIQYESECIMNSLSGAESYYLEYKESEE